MKAPRIVKPGHCAAGHRFADDSEVILTSTGVIACASEAHVFTPDAIVASGTYREIRQQHKGRENR